MDALLLASCDAFIHADSNLTIAAGIMCLGALFLGHRRRNPECKTYHVRELCEGLEAQDWPGYKRCSLPF